MLQCGAAAAAAARKKWSRAGPLIRNSGFLGKGDEGPVVLVRLCGTHHDDDDNTAKFRSMMVNVADVNHRITITFKEAEVNRLNW